MKEKYTEGYFEHWLAMLSTMNTAFTKEGFEMQINHYLDFEGEDEMRNLQNEVELILKEGDLNNFINIGNELGIEEVSQQSLESMTSVIINWNK